MLLDHGGEFLAIGHRLADALNADIGDPEAVAGLGVLDLADGDDAVWRPLSTIRQSILRQATCVQLMSWCAMS